MSKRPEITITPIPRSLSDLQNSFSPAHCLKALGGCRVLFVVRMSGVREAEFGLYVCDLNCLLVRVRRKVTIEGKPTPQLVNGSVQPSNWKRVALNIYFKMCTYLTGHRNTSHSIRTGLGPLKGPVFAVLSHRRAGLVPRPGLAAAFHVLGSHGRPGSSRGRV